VLTTWLAILAGGFVLTIELSALTLVLSMVVAALVALMSSSPWRLLRVLASAYVDVFRSIPILALAISVYYGLGATLHDLGITPFGTAVAVLTAIESAYLAELYRGASESIRRPQWDAASSLGLGWLATVRHVILPQALPAAIPITLNMAIAIVKDSSLVSLIACALVILPMTGVAVFRTGRLRHHVMRSLSQFCSQTFLIIAFSLMPLAGAIAINFSAPLFTALVSIVLLKEKVGLARWSALLVGFLGVLIVTHPGAGAFQVGALFALANAVMYGTVTAAVRGMTATESAATLTLYQLLFITGFFALIAPFGFIMPTWTDGGLIVFNGLSIAVGQYWWTKSLHLGPASAIAPFFYLSLVWAAAIGFLVWGDVPTLGLLIGSAIVVGSGLFLLWREARRGQAALDGATPQGRE